MKTIIKICLLSLTLALFSCHRLEYGTVTSKCIEPERLYYDIMPIATSKSVVMIPYLVHDNADYCMVVSGINNKGDSITETFYINHTAYDTIKVGDFVCVNGKCNQDNNNTKTYK